MRRELKGKRKSTTIKAKVGGITIFLSLGEHADGKLGELFIDTAKEGSAFKELLNCFAIAVSVGLQYGVPLDKFISLFKGVKFDPSGLVKGHPTIKSAESVVDYIFKVVELEYGGH